MSEVLDSYLEASTLRSAAGAARMVLQTAAGMTPQGLVAHPVFFRGAIARPDVAAAGLRTLVEVASTRYFNPIPGGFASLDPVMTANGDRLRCEAFSACNGVYARLDLLAESFDAGSLGFGTTNIDINPPLALALAGIGAQHQLHLSVGPDAVRMETPAGAFTERKVKLPERWVRALAETQCLAGDMRLRASFDALGWRRFVNGLSTAGGSGAGVSTWLLPSATGLRATRQAEREAVSLAGTARLSAVKRLQHLVRAVRVYGPDVDAGTQAAPSAWEFDLPGARLLLMLSPEPWRGFSGEGAMLRGLSQVRGADVQTVAALLAWDPVIDPAALAQESRLEASRVQSALQALATSGHVGFDLHEQAFFHRQLAYQEERLTRNYPRLAAARELLAGGAVRRAGSYFEVRGEEHSNWVRSGDDGALRCSCVFWAKHRGSRGPCKHILAVELLEGRLAAGE